MHYEVKVTAMGEVRDTGGNLVSSEPVEAVMLLTADEFNQMIDPARLNEEN